MLSGGISGISLNHGDLGGYTDIYISLPILDIPILDYTRHKELFYRWMEFGVFTALFRSHPGNNN